MNKNLKTFLHRGMLFGGFGPLIGAIIYFIINLSVKEDIVLSAPDILIMVASTYLLAFVHAGSSIFNQIDNWSILKSLCFHSITLYLAYVICYLVNSWIEFNLIALLIFTAIFILVYFIIWLTVVLTLKSTSKKLNKKIK